MRNSVLQWLALVLPLFQPSLTAAREITFPPVSGYTGPPQADQYQHHGHPQYDAQLPLAHSTEGIDLATGSAFAGLTTFANLEHVHCLSAEPEVDRYDIAFLGAPFDTGVTARPGARFGPGGIRRGSRRISGKFAWSAYTGENTFEAGYKIIDCGDAPLTFLDNTVALKQLDKAHEIISGRTANSSEYTIPRIIMLGGDHTTTLSALRSTFKRWGPVSVIHFDSHLDTWNPNVIGGGISHYASVNHGTFLHIAHEEGLILNHTSIHAGIRAPFGNSHASLDNDRRCGFEIVKARDIDRIGTNGVIDALKARVNGTRVYISVDIDVLDPAFAPATGTAEVGGWSTRELLTILDGLVGLEVVGADVVEVAPIYDNPGETTLLAAAEVAHSLMSLMVKTPVKA